ncbi:MAG TPA: GDP-mannose 4,6-dehydratase [Phenylobacterium sp.]|uniref:GDP-mannose 4,6-dehydratase n=1 Tax=Phenylobacterium sp. TaxID=1871053 RepID=UPI002B7D4CC1|nr:GDP-mannose 4,6-dehydratase [Phenylobacterium sp.]HSV04623.1 GDP-mannose 4,6-dehydratase [Phenylobacterium sp.]
MKTAFITGVSGQDGSYLTDLLLRKGYVVHGVVRRSSNIDRPRLDHITSDLRMHDRQFFLHYCDLEDTTNLRRIILHAHPDEIYHFAGQSHVGLSFETPESTCDFTAMGTLRLLEIIRDLDPSPRFLNMGSSEIFGRPAVSPQDETTPVAPVSPYGVAKAFAVQMTKVYRESFHLFACSAICYNHESERRSPAFVTRKIARAVAEIRRFPEAKLRLGRLDTTRDWGYAPEYVEAMWRIMQLNEPTDVVLATGRPTSVAEFLSYAFEHAGLDWKAHVLTDDRLIRPAEPLSLVGDPSKAERLLDWRAKTTARDLARLMVDAELKGQAGMLAEGDRLVTVVGEDVGA